MQPLSRGRGTGSRSCRSSTHDLWLDGKILNVRLYWIFYSPGFFGCKEMEEYREVTILLCLSFQEEKTSWFCFK